MSDQIDCVSEVRDRLVEIGDLDLKRNLKIRAFMELVLAPVFRDLQPRLRYDEMGRRGITPMQYFQDFRNYPASQGYGRAGLYGPEIKGARRFVISPYTMLVHDVEVLAKE